MDSHEQRELRATVHGRVQGVAFREFVRRSAAALGVVGWVRNLPNGATVEVVAQGDEGALRALLNDLWRGPLAARVERVEAGWGVPHERFLSFDVRR